MDLEIEPEPSPGQRAAILAALERLGEEPALPAWWQAAVLENVMGDEEVMG